MYDEDAFLEMEYEDRNGALVDLDDDCNCYDYLDEDEDDEGW